MNNDLVLQLTLSLSTNLDFTQFVRYKPINSFLSAKGSSKLLKKYVQKKCQLFFGWHFSLCLNNAFLLY
jgi:hypothetical protein